MDVLAHTTTARRTVLAIPVLVCNNSLPQIPYFFNFFSVWSGALRL